MMHKQASAATQPIVDHEWGVHLCAHVRVRCAPECGVHMCTHETYCKVMLKIMYIRNSIWKDFAFKREKIIKKK